MQALEIEARPFQPAWANIGQKHICVCSKLSKDFLSFVGARVQNDRLFAAIIEVEDRIVLDIRADCAEEITNRITAGWFDLDDVSAPVAQDAASPGCRHICGVFDYFNAVQHRRILSLVFFGQSPFGKLGINPLSPFIHKSRSATGIPPRYDCTKHASGTQRRRSYSSHER